jgi:hypothetical protein
MISRRITGALAWIGLVIVIAVPSADILLSRLAPQQTARSVSVPVAKPAPKATPEPVTALEAKPVAKPVPVAVEPAVQQAAVAAQPAGDAGVSGDPVKDYLATNKSLPSYITPAKPAAAGEQPVATTAPPAGAAAPAGANGVASADPSAGAAPSPKPAASRPKPLPAPSVTEADLKGWKSGTLEDYLRQNGLLTTNPPSSGRN